MYDIPRDAFRPLMTMYPSGFIMKSTGELYLNLFWLCQGKIIRAYSQMSILHSCIQILACLHHVHMADKLQDHSHSPPGSNCRSRSTHSSILVCSCRLQNFWSQERMAECMGCRWNRIQNGSHPGSTDHPGSIYLWVEKEANGSSSAIQIFQEFWQTSKIKIYG